MNSSRTRKEEEYYTFQNLVCVYCCYALYNQFRLPASNKNRSICRKIFAPRLSCNNSAVNKISGSPYRCGLRFVFNNHYLGTFRLRTKMGCGASRAKDQEEDEYCKFKLNIVTDNVSGMKKGNVDDKQSTFNSA